MKILSIEKIDGWDGDVIPGDPVDGDLVRVTYGTGSTVQAVVERIYREKVIPESPNLVFVHIDVSGPEANGVVSIKSDGSNSATITFTLRVAEDPSSAVLDSVNKVWSVPLRNSDNTIYDYLGIKYTNGVAIIDYTGAKPGMISIRRNDVNDIIGNAIVTLANEPEFLVYRDFTA